MASRDRELMMKLAFYALYEPPGRADEQASCLLEPLPHEVSEQRLQALLDAHFPPISVRRAEDAASPGPGATRRREDRRRTMVNVGSIIALAAAVLLVWLLQRPRPAPELQAMPTFVAELHELDPERMRGDGPHDVRCPARPARRHTLVVCLIPSHAIDEPLSVAAFAEQAEGEGRWLPLAQFEQSDEGVLRLEQPIESLALSPGRWRITFHVKHTSRPTDAVVVEAVIDLGPGAEP